MSDSFLLTVTESEGPASDSLEIPARYYYTMDTCDFETMRGRRGVCTP